MRKFQSKLRSKRGFSLVELAIAMGIVVILIVTITMGSGLKQTAKVLSLTKSIGVIENALHTYAIKYGAYTGESIEELKNAGVLPLGFSGECVFGGEYIPGIYGPNAMPGVTVTHIVDKDVADKVHDMLWANSFTIRYQEDGDVLSVVFLKR